MIMSQIECSKDNFFTLCSVPTPSSTIFPTERRFLQLFNPYSTTNKAAMVKLLTKHKMLCVLMLTEVEIYFLLFPRRSSTEIKSSSKEGNPPRLKEGNGGMPSCLSCVRPPQNAKSSPPPHASNCSFAGKHKQQVVIQTIQAKASHHVKVLGSRRIRRFLQFLWFIRWFVQFIWFLCRRRRRRRTWRCQSLGYG